MRKIENYEDVQASTGEFNRLPAGGYVCEILKVTDVPINENGKGDYLKIEFDIAEGEFAGYYQEQFDRWHGAWNGTFIRSYKEKALGMFKQFTNCIEESNLPYKWEWQENTLAGKLVGLVLAEEEYQNSNSEVKTKLSVRYIKTVDEIRKGDFTVPPVKKLDGIVEKVEAFTPVIDEDLPWQ